MTIDNVAKRWGLSLTEGVVGLQSRSAASVREVRTGDTKAILKLTDAAASGAAMAAARRELAFYTAIAPMVPRVAPRLLNVYDGDDGLALLIEHVGRTMPAADWDRRRWRSLAETIAQVHQVGGVARTRFTHASSLQQALMADSGPAMAFWRDLTPAAPVVIDLIRKHIPSLLRRDCFVHGDLHLDNILVSAEQDGVRIADWQQCGLGSAAADLAFINVRLAPSGLTVPGSFLDAYSAATGSDRGWLGRAMAYVELATYLLVWPPFAAYNSDPGIHAVRSRTARLAAWALAEELE